VLRGADRQRSSGGFGARPRSSAEPAFPALVSDRSGVEKSTPGRMFLLAFPREIRQTHQLHFRVDSKAFS
jgi:hypothetical protein